jgi:D-3-phosphoglycerate dehydrogenase
MKVIIYDPFVSDDVAKSIGVDLVNLEELLKNSDYITVHVPLNEKTRNLINKKEFEIMKQGVRIINVGRGGIINEKALYDAIVNNKVSGAAIDVWENEPPHDSPLLELENVLATPHLGASTEEAQNQVATEIAEQIADYLNKNIIKGGVNFISIKPELYPLLTPYLALVEKIGSISTQLCEGHMDEIEIKYQGPIAEYDIRTLTSVAVKGALYPVCGDHVNMVNSLLIAKERQIRVTESKSTDVRNFTNLIKLNINTDKGKKCISGTLFEDKKPRIVKIDDFEIDLIPEKYMLVTYHKDIPGMVGKVGSILGKYNINIAGMAVGRKTVRGNAVMILTLDEDISDDLLKEIKDIANMKNVKLIRT